MTLAETEMTIDEIKVESIQLLNRFLDRARSGLEGHELTLREAFVFRHASNIASIAEDVLRLNAEGRVNSTYVLMRPLFEGLIFIAAARKSETFAAEKILAETREHVKRLKQWDTVAGFSDLSAMIQVLTDFAATIRRDNPAAKQRSWPTCEAAELAGLPQHYVREYYMFSQNIHVTLAGLVAQEFDTHAAMVIFCTLYVALATIAYAAPLVAPPAQDEYTNVATRLLTQLNNIHQKERTANKASMIASARSGPRHHDAGRSI